MKTCPKCGSDTNPFNKNQAAADGLQTYCRSCTKRIKKTYYAKHKESHCAKSAESKRERRRIAQEYVIKLKGDPCSDCGLRFKPWQMDFDHLRDKRPGNRNTVSGLVAGGYVLDVVKAEIAKCELVCANCHRNRTFQRAQQAHGHETLYTLMV